MAREQELRRDLRLDLETLGRQIERARDLAPHGVPLTDMETCYKIMRSDVARGLGLTADRFDIEPEITARLLLQGHRIVERPIVFTPRSRAAGKKIGWRDGVTAIRVLVGHRFGRRPKP